MERTLALLAFPEPHKAACAAPLLPLLDPSNRATVAAELNAALLRSWGQSAEPRLKSLLKLALLKESMLQDCAVLPEGFRLAALAAASSAGSRGIGQSAAEGCIGSR